jgi:hypothetical protein
VPVPKFRVAFTSYWSNGEGLVPSYPIGNKGARQNLPYQLRKQRLFTLKNTGDSYLTLDTARFDPDTVIAWLKDGYHDNIRILDGDVSDHEGPEFQYRPVLVTFIADKRMTAEEFDAVATIVTERMSTIPGEWAERTTGHRGIFLGIYKVWAKSEFLFSDDWDRALERASETLSDYACWIVDVLPVPEDHGPMPFEPLDEAEARLGFRARSCG